LKPNIDYYTGNATFHNLEKFLDKVNTNKIRYISISGVHGDPCQANNINNLIEYIRDNNKNLTISLHTNALHPQSTEIINQCDKATITYPSFIPYVYKDIMRVPYFFDIKKSIKKYKTPIKLSMLLPSTCTPALLDHYIYSCRGIGVKRIVLRQIMGEEPLMFPYRMLKPYYARNFKNNKVYDVDGVEVTIWDWEKTSITGLYLMPNGKITDVFSI